MRFLLITSMVLLGSVASANPSSQSCYLLKSSLKEHARIPGGRGSNLLAVTTIHSDGGYHQAELQVYGELKNEITVKSLGSEGFLDENSEVEFSTRDRQVRFYIGKGHRYLRPSGTDRKYQLTKIKTGSCEF